MNRILCIVCLSVLIAATASAEDVFGLPAYPSMHVVPFEGSMRTNDVPLDAAVVMTGDPIKRVMEYYRLALEQRGLKTVQHMFSPESGYVGFFDLDSGTMRMATVVSRPDGGTMIVLSSMDPTPLLEKPAAIPPDLPSVPGAVDVVTSDMEEGSSRQRTVRFTLPGTSPADARAMLLQAAKKQNWTAVGAAKPFDQKDLILKRKDDMCIVKIHPLPAEEGGKPSVSVTMIAIDRGAE